MANPQAEDGHVDIANEIMEALAMISIPSEPRRVLDFILRKTYGWHKKEDAIPLSQFEKGTGLTRPHVCRAINRLVSMNLIYKDSPRPGTTQSQHRDYRITTYGFNKHFDQWVGSPNGGTSPRSGTEVSPQAGNKLVPRLAHSKENQKKLQKKGVSHPLTTDEYVEKLKSSPNYAHIDWKYELEEMRLWVLKPENLGRVINPRFILNWIKKIPRPLSLVTAKQDIKPARVMMDGILKECIKGEWVEVKQ